MKHSGRALGMVMGAALLSAACGPATEVEIDIDEPGLEAMGDKPGSTDPNGAAERGFQIYKPLLAYAMMTPLLQGGVVNPTLTGSTIFSDPDGEENFEHAFRCAMSETTAVTINGKTYTGRGMVSGASVWIGQGLPQSVINNVLECMIAFVNDETDGLQILLTSLNVIDDPDEDHTPFIYSEALWCARTPTPTMVIMDVYPTASFIKGCGIDAEAALKQRVCWQEGSCDLNYMGKLEDAGNCTEMGEPGNGQYECSGQRCTMTWLAEKTPAWCQSPPTPPRL